MPECIGVKFDNGPKIHYVEVENVTPAVGTTVVVRTRRGFEIAKVRTDVTSVERCHGMFERIATPADIEQYEQLTDRAEDLKWFTRARTRQANIDAKIIKLEFSLDETLLVVSYSAEQNANMKPLASALAEYTNARVEFLNVGPRDQARMLGTLGVCGDGSCSSTWLQTFSSVSIRMARDQQLPLNPEKISGPCGRLMCCLQFEHEMYKELLRELPKKGAKACHTESGTCGRVVKLYPLAGTVELRTDEGVMHEFTGSEIERMRGGQKPRSEDRS